MLRDLISASVIVLSGVILLMIEHYAFKKLLATKQRQYWQYFILRAFNRPIKIIIILTSAIYLIEFFYISTNSFFTSEDFDTAKLIILVSALTWGTLSFIKRLEKYFLKTNSLSKHSEKERHRSTIILLMKLCFVTSFVIGILILLHTVGVRMQAIIAFISLSGVAIGISSRDLVASLFGTMLIYTNGPFSIGDKIKISNLEGVVENITWLSTRLRLDNRNLTYIPNIQFLNTAVENISYALERRLTIFLDVFHSNFQEKQYAIEEIISNIRSILIQSDEDKYNPRVNYEFLGADERCMYLKIRIYFEKYITKDELHIQKLKMTSLISDKLISRNMRFTLKFED